MKVTQTTIKRKTNHAIYIEEIHDYIYLNMGDYVKIVKVDYKSEFSNTNDNIIYTIIYTQCTGHIS